MIVIVPLISVTNVDLTVEKERKLPWELREYLPLHLGVLARPGHLLDRLQNRYQLSTRPEIQTVTEAHKANCDLLIPVHNSRLIIECKAEQNPKSENTTVELLSHVFEPNIKNSLGWKSSAKRTTTRQSKPHVFDNLAEVIKNHSHKGLATANLPVNHYSCFWRKTSNQNVHRLFKTSTLQLAIASYLQEAEAEIGFSPSGNVLFVLVPPSVLSKAALIEETNLTDLEKYCNDQRADYYKKLLVDDKAICQSKSNNLQMGT